MIEFTPEQRRAIRQLAKMSRPSPIRTYARCFLASRLGRGVRLSFDDVLNLFADGAVETALCAAVQDIVDGESD